MNSVILRSWLAEPQNACRVRGTLIGIAAPQGYNKNRDYVEIAMVKGSVREGRWDGGEGKDNPNHVHSPSHLVL